MRQHFSRTIGTVFCAAVCVCLSAFAGEQPDGVANYFNVTIKAAVTVTTDNVATKMETETAIGYAWLTRGAERTLSLKSLRFRMKNDDGVADEFTQSRDSVIHTAEGKTNEISFDNAPPDLKRQMKASFGVALLKIATDADGRILSRTVVAGDDASTIMESGVVANALLFHPPFISGQQEWQADSEISMGGGSYAKGKLTYTKGTSGPKGQTVKVSGTLTKEEFKKAGTPMSMKGIKYTVEGEETYDAARHEWIAGKMAVRFEYQVAMEGSITISSASGTMAVQFERVDEK